MQKYRIETDSLGEIKVPKNKLWGAQTQRSLEHFAIGSELIPLRVIYALALIKKAAAKTNYSLKKLEQKKMDLIVEAADEILGQKHNEQFPLHVWMTGSGTQSNMNVNEVIANLCCLSAKTELGSKNPVHPNDDVNKSQSSNDTFPSAMLIATIFAMKEKLLPAIDILTDELKKKVKEWKNIVKIGRTHMQDAVPLTLGQEFSGYLANIEQHKINVTSCIHHCSFLPLGGTALGTGLNAPINYDKLIVKTLSELTGIEFFIAKNKFALQGSHDALGLTSATLKCFATSLYKMGNDIRLLSCGPRAGFYELIIPANEPGSSIMPGKVNPTQCEALTMVSLQVIANDLAVTMSNGSGILDMNVYKPIIIYNILQSIEILSDSIVNFTKFLLAGTKANKEKIEEYVNRSLMLVTAISPTIGYDEASKIAHYAYNHNCTLAEANKKLKIISQEEFERIIDPLKMI